MKKEILSLTVLVTLIVPRAWGQQACPLTNVKLTDLRTAASKLAKTITLSPACKSYQDTVNQANSQLKDIAGQIQTFDQQQAKTNGTELQIDAKATALAAVTQLDTVSNLFKDDRCGQELSGFMDYASTFVDVALGMAPFLAIYGGPEAMPWVLGASLGGAAAKAVISFFKNKNINMRDPDQSNSFIKNSCAFFNLHVIKTSLDDLQMKQTPKIEQFLAESKNRLGMMKTQTPDEPNVDVLKRFKLSEKDKEKIKFVKDQMASDAVEGCSYIRTFANREDENYEGTLVDRVWENYSETLNDNRFRQELERKYFMDELNPMISNLTDFKPEDIAKCNRWVTKVAAMNEAGYALLKKGVDENPDLKTYREFVAAKQRLEDSVKLQEARLKFFNELTGSGFNIEYSEIIRSHQQVQDVLFESSKWLKLLRMKGIAEAWLTVKFEDAQTESDNFRLRKKEVEDRIAKVQKTIGKPFTRDNVEAFSREYVQANHREHPEVTAGLLIDVCNQLRRTWSSWYNGLIHSRAGKDYCNTFDTVINRLDYPHVQGLCFGTTDSHGKLLQSLRNQAEYFTKKKAEADAVAERIRTLSCKESADLTQDLLSLPLE
ncbi:MAG: hypothetical protein ACJ76H_08175 [Bacteriovoracaceae bacterium]